MQNLTIVLCFQVSVSDVLRNDALSSNGPRLPPSERRTSPQRAKNFPQRPQLCRQGDPRVSRSRQGLGALDLGNRRLLPEPAAPHPRGNAPRTFAGFVFRQRRAPPHRSNFARHPGDWSGERRVLRHQHGEVRFEYVRLAAAR